MGGRRTAMGRYIEYLAYEWSRMAIPFDRVVLMAPRPIELPPLATSTPVSAKVFGSRLPLVVWEQVALPARTTNVSVLFCPAYIAPLVSQAPVVVANHGIYERFPDGFSKFQRLRTTPLYRLSARRSARTIANSLNTRIDIAEYFGVPESDIDVVYPAANEMFFQQHPPEQVAAEAERILGAPAPYFIFVGKLSRRRHVPELIEAFGLFRARTSSPHRLLIVGPNTTGYEIPALAAASGVADAVTYLPHLEHHSLALLYTGADAFVLPTTYEGISHTMFEAMASGTPVLTVQHPTLAEGAGDAVLALASPSPKELCEGMRRLATDTELRRDLRVRGRARAAAFSWDRAARETISVLDRVALPEDRGPEGRPSAR
jgi:glycosyltransferase involved in cell wall biosynthesis